MIFSCPAKAFPPPVQLISFTLDGVSYQAEEGMTWGEWLESEYSKDLPKTMPCGNCGGTLQIGFYGDSLGYFNGSCWNPFANTKDYGKLIFTDRIVDGFNARIEVSSCFG